MTAHPISDSIPTYGVREKASATLRSRSVERKFRRDGYVVLPNVFSEALLRDVSALIDQVYDLQMREAGGLDLLESANDSDIIRCPLAYDERFWLSRRMT